MRPYLLIDFGSTFTKVTAVDAERPALLGQAKAPTTADTDINIGLRRALHLLRGRLGTLPRFAAKLACSSAAGGLRLVAVGLVPDLTAKAARQAALGAGAKVVGTYAYQLTPTQLRELAALDPDMILLAGGTDGGNAEVVLHNARMLANSDLPVPVVFAGNQAVRDEVVDLLRAAGKTVRATANVMPRLYELDVDPARQVIRELFLEHIVSAKGLDRAREILDEIVMPTPAAVLRAAQLLADGPGDRPGLGPLAVIDIGGATTDVHSVSAPGALDPAVTVKGLEEPYAKRTVEGDLGMRASAPALMEAVGADRLAALLRRTGPAVVAAAVQALDGEALVHRVERLGRETGRLPADAEDWIIDHVLGRAAAGEAMHRHAGRLREVQMPSGRHYYQYGKDLRSLRLVIGTGGIFVHSPCPELLFADIRYDPGRPEVLCPKDPALAVDAAYLLAPMGLLAEHEPLAAFTLLHQHLRYVGGVEARDEERLPDA